MNPISSLLARLRRPAAQPAAPTKTGARALVWPGPFSGTMMSRERRVRYAALNDTNKLLPQGSWRTMTAFARALYSTLGEVRGPILEKANLSVGDGWIPQFTGTDTAWGRKAEVWLWEWMKIADVRGSPYDFHTDLRLASVALDRDGDIGVLLTENADGYPLIKLFAGHRIGSRTDGKVEAGPYAGLQIFNGVIFNAEGRTVAYRLLGDSEGDDRDVSARDLCLTFDPDWCDQARGISALYHAITALQDRQDIDDYTLQGIKAAATRALVEENESGESDSGSGRTNLTADASGLQVQDLLGGTIQYFKAGTGSKLSVVDDKRPSTENQAFKESLLRAAYQGLEWPYEFTRDAKEIGGANVRVVVSKINRTVKKRQAILRKLATRIAGYALSKGIKNKALPPSKEWWMWDWQMPAALTADAGRDSQAARENYKMGMGTLRDYFGSQGQWWEEQLDQRIAEAKAIKEKCAAAGVDVRAVQLLTPNEVAKGDTPDGAVDPEEPGSEGEPADPKTSKD